jgi:hypothetical protein
MASIINAATSGGLITTADTSGILQLQTAGTTAVTVDDSQRVAFVAGTASLPAITTTGDTNTGIFFPAADTIAFAEGGAEAMRIDSSGNLGIGTTSPTQTVSVGILSGTKGFNIVYPPSSTELACFTANAATGEVRIGGTGSTYFPTFYSNGSERARIDTSGNLLVGTTGVPNGTSIYGSGFAPISFGRSRLSMACSSTSGLELVQFFNPNGQVGNISTSGSATAYNTSSDYRLKNTIAPMTGALAKVALLKPSTYKWNVDGSDGEGFIAHELAEVMPQAVSGEKDGIETYTDEDGNEATRPVYQGIDVSFLVATLTAAIQEQQALITQLQADVSALKGASV